MENISSFIEAIKEGNLKEVERLLDGTQSLVNAKNENGVSAVLVSVYYGEPAITDLLIQRGAELDIFEASAAGHKNRVAELLAQDKSLANAYAPDGFQPLGLACFFGHTSIVTLLLTHGADVNSPSRNSSRVQPLHSAVAGRHLEIARTLLEHGADVNALQQDSFAPIHEAAQNGDIAMIKLLISQHANLTMKKSDGQTALDIALEKGYIKAAELLRESN